MTVTPDPATDEQAAPLAECVLSIFTSMPASWRHVRSHLAIMQLKIGSCFPIHGRELEFFSLKDLVLLTYSCRDLTWHKELSVV